MQSPRGDGNNISSHYHNVISYNLRNAVPERGRKLFCLKVRYCGRVITFEKCSPREGTETKIMRSECRDADFKFEKCSPREGTETSFFPFFQTHLMKLFEKCSPREGTETASQTPHNQNIPFEKCSPREGTETISFFTSGGYRFLI